MWHLRHWLQFWQLRTWIHDNLCYLTFNCDKGQHSQFLWCFIYLCPPSPTCVYHQRGCSQKTGSKFVYDFGAKSSINNYESLWKEGVLSWNQHQICTFALTRDPPRWQNVENAARDLILAKISKYEELWNPEMWWYQKRNIKNQLWHCWE